MSGSVVFQTRSSSVGTETCTPTRTRRAASCSTSRSRTTSGPRVMIENGVSAPGELDEACACEPVATLGRLVRVGGGADRDLLARPGAPPKLAAQHVGNVHLDADRATVAVAGVTVGAGLEGADVAERAAVRAAHVRVQPPAKRHPRDTVESASARLLSVLRAHTRMIEHMFDQSQRQASIAPVRVGRTASATGPVPDTRARLAGTRPRAWHVAQETAASTMPAATVSFVASSTRMNAPVVRLTA